MKQIMCLKGTIFHQKLEMKNDEKVVELIKNAKAKNWLTYLRFETDNCFIRLTPDLVRYQQMCNFYNGKQKYSAASFSNRHYLFKRRVATFYLYSGFLRLIASSLWSFYIGLQKITYAMHCFFSLLVVAFGFNWQLM